MSIMISANMKENVLVSGEENLWSVPWEGFVKRSRRLRN